MAKQKTARKPSGLARSYPYYLANRPVEANADLEVLDKYSGKRATRVALADATAVRKAIVAAAKVEIDEAYDFDIAAEVRSRLKRSEPAFGHSSAPAQNGS